VTQVAVATRRDLPLDDRTWLVLPFDNTARSGEAEVIRQAGLSMLYQELSRWSDVRVVSDDRVNDLLRALPEPQRALLGLEAARALARRVGAARVVIGDYLALGPSAQITAKIYDVRSGRQVRVARERLTGFTAPAALDSMSATYSRLGAAILGLPPRRDAGSLAGTASMAAFRAYIDGMAALNRVDIAQATEHFRQAVAADSSFALGWYRLHQTAFDTSGRRQYMAMAERFAGNLPPLERAKLALFGSLQRGTAEACDPAARVLALDSSDAEGWVGVARCELQPTPLRPFPGDTVRRLPARNYQSAAEAARRAVQSDPGYVFANVTLLFTLRATNIGPLCERDAAAPCPRDSLWAGALVPSGDSVIMPLERWDRVRADPPWLRPAAVTIRRSRAAEVRRAADAWLVLSPGNRAARLLLARAHLDLGDPAEAARIVDTMPTYLGPNAPFVGHGMRLQLDLALEREDIARRVDSLYGSVEGAGLGGQMFSMVGKFGADAGKLASVAAQRTARESWLPVVAGVLPDGFDSATAALAAMQTAQAHIDVLEVSTLLAFRMRGSAPALDTAAAHPIRRFQAFLARGDTARARHELARHDSVLARRPVETPDDAGWLFAAESHLALGDSARALAHMLDWLRRWHTSPKAFNDRILDQNFAFAVPRLYGRMWLLLADLAAAANRRDEARRAFRMVINLWEQGDAPVQPLVTRARAALATLGN
jgi:tetratricopeptide (TPR) repeat protein